MPAFYFDNYYESMVLREYPHMVCINGAVGTDDTLAKFPSDSWMGYEHRYASLDEPRKYPTPYGASISDLFVCFRTASDAMRFKLIQGKFRP